MNTEPTDSALARTKFSAYYRTKFRIACRAAAAAAHRDAWDAYIVAEDALRAARASGCAWDAFHAAADARGDAWDDYIVARDDYRAADDDYSDALKQE